jgi:Flp pilus assembly protein TadG
VAIEFAVVLPIVIVLIFAMIQYGIILNTRQIMASAARTAIRSYAVGVSTEAEAEQMAINLMNNATLNFDVDITDDGTDATIRITLPMADAALVDALGKSLMDGDIDVSFSMRLEN